MAPRQARFPVNHGLRARTVLQRSYSSKVEREEVASPFTRAPGEGDVPLPENESVDPDVVVTCSVDLEGDQVREGVFQGWRRAAVAVPLYVHWVRQDGIPLARTH